MQLLMTPEGKKVQVNLREDLCLYDSPHNPPNTGTEYTSGSDLYYHKTRSGRGYFYTYYWSMWEGEQSCYTLVTEDEAKSFILHRATLTRLVSDGVNESNCSSLWGEDFFGEDA